MKMAPETVEYLIITIMYVLFYGIAFDYYIDALIQKQDLVG